MPMLPNRCERWRLSYEISPSGPDDCWLLSPPNPVRTRRLSCCETIFDMGSVMTRVLRSSFWIEEGSGSPGSPKDLRWA